MCYVKPHGKDTYQSMDNKKIRIKLDSSHQKMKMKTHERAQRKVN